MARSSSRTTKGERREHKKRRRMPVTGKQIFTLQRLMRTKAARARGPRPKGPKPKDPS